LEKDEEGKKSSGKKSGRGEGNRCFDWGIGSRLFSVDREEPTKMVGTDKRNERKIENGAGRNKNPRQNEKNEADCVIGEKGGESKKKCLVRQQTGQEAGTGHQKGSQERVGVDTFGKTYVGKGVRGLDPRRNQKTTTKSFWTKGSGPAEKKKKNIACGGRSD